MPGPLSGLKIIELAAIGPVPFAGALLADMGADVLRIDRVPAAGETPALDPRYDFYNRNKRSLALDLKQPGGAAIVLRLLKTADILLEGFRPGVTERLGLSPEACMEVNSRLIYGRMTGWGQTGPRAKAAGHDINYLALTGALHAIGPADRPPPPPLNLVADLGGGAMYLVAGVLAAVIEARISGQGQVIDAAMIDGVTNLMSAFHAFRQTGSWAGRDSNIVDGGAPYYGTYETKDGEYIAIGAMEPQFYAALLKRLGLDPATLPPQADRAAWPQLRGQFAAIFRTRTKGEWESAMAGEDVCFAPVLSMDEAVDDPHMQARGVFTLFDGVRHPTPAPRFSRTPASLRRSAPAPGEHSGEILLACGFTISEIAALRANGITG